MLRLFCLFALAWAGITTVVTITPHNDGACSNACRATFIPHNGTKCTMIHTAAVVVEQNNKHIPVSFAFTQNQNGFALKCDCHPSSLPLITWNQATNDYLQGQLWGSYSTTCGLIGSPRVFPCNKVDNFTCNRPQPKAIVHIDFDQEYPHCGLQACLSDKGWLPSGSNYDYCKYSQHVYDCLTDTDCVSLTTVKKCEGLTTICPGLTCPTASNQLCPQTPPRVLSGGWDCSNNTCLLLCEPGFVANWKGHKVMQYAAVCNVTRGKWDVNVDITKGCVPGSCTARLKKYCGIANGTDPCTYYKTYFACADKIGCGEDVLESCDDARNQVGPHCDLPCPSLPGTCPPTPQAALHGDWTCANSSCTLLCDDGYFINYPTNGFPLYAAICDNITQQWQLKVSSPPCLGCQFSKWGQWGSCSDPCNGGYQTRARSILSGNNDDCYRSMEIRDCNVDPCPNTDCQAGQWSAWSPCSSPCGFGNSVRTRVVTGPGDCPLSVDSKPCNTQPCGPEPGCEYSDWAPWSQCAEPCGGGVSTRTRRVLRYTPTSTCGDTQQSNPCAPHPCCYNCDCDLSPWAKWSQCTKPCDSGFQVRSRTVISGNRLCPFVKPLNESRPCNILPCADCSYGEWSKWGECSDICGTTAIQSRTRSVVKFTAGRPCASTTADDRPCNRIPCPTNYPCEYSEWSKWGACTKPCMGGIQSRTRTLLNGTSQLCFEAVNKRECNTSPCD